MQKSGKVVHIVGSVSPRWIQLPGKVKERLGVLVEVVNVEYCLRIWKVVLLEVVIETRAWSPAKD